METPRYSDREVVDALAPHLHSGEPLLAYAFGMRFPNFWLLVALLCLGILPGLALMLFGSRLYFVGLTDRRLVVVQVKGQPVQVLAMTDYDRAALPPVRAKAGVQFTSLWIDDPEHPVRIRFSRIALKENERQSRAIAAALTGDRTLLPG
ncbi:MAG: hypothetical protein KDA49_03865 [Rhodospirillaceae bacterium]|nr:hypothetical protein [Rhodospirillaceae bacterium]